MVPKMAKKVIKWWSISIRNTLPTLVVLALPLFLLVPLLVGSSFCAIDAPCGLLNGALEFTPTVTG